VKLRGETKRLGVIMADFYQNFMNNVQDLSEHVGLDFGSYSEILGVKGYCFGLSCMWGQAILAGDTRTYFARLKLLTRDYLASPIRAHGVSYNKLSNFLYDEIFPFEYGARQYKGVGKTNYYRGVYEHLGIPYSEFDLYMTIRAFLDGMLIYQTPGSTFLKGQQRSTNQYSMVASEYVFPQTLVDRNGLEPNNLCTTYNRAFYLSKRKLKNIFYSLVDIVSKIEVPFFVIFSSIDHAIGFTIKGKTKLKIYDANAMQIDMFDLGKLFDTQPDVLNGREKIYELLLLSFSENFKESRSDLLSLNISIHLWSKNKEIILRSIAEGCIRRDFFDQLEDKLSKYILPINLTGKHKARARHTLSQIKMINKAEPTLTGNWV
jgi:hypothetical protein